MSTFENGLEALIKKANLNETQANRLRETVAGADPAKFAEGFEKWYEKQAEISRKQEELFQKFAKDKGLNEKQAAAVRAEIEKRADAPGWLQAVTNHMPNNTQGVLDNFMRSHGDVPAPIGAALGAAGGALPGAAIGAGLGGLAGGIYGGLRQKNPDEGRLAAIAKGMGLGVLGGGAGGGLAGATMGGLQGLARTYDNPMK